MNVVSKVESFGTTEGTPTAKIVISKCGELKKGIKKKSKGKKGKKK